MNDFALLVQDVFPLLTLASAEIDRLNTINNAGARAEAAHYRTRCWIIATFARTVYAHPLSSAERRDLLTHCALLAGELPPALTMPPKGEQRHGSE